MTPESEYALEQRDIADDHARFEYQWTIDADNYQAGYADGYAGICQHQRWRANPPYQQGYSTGRLDRYVVAENQIHCWEEF